MLGAASACCKISWPIIPELPARSVFFIYWQYSSPIEKASYTLFVTSPLNLLSGKKEAMSLSVETSRL